MMTKWWQTLVSIAVGALLVLVILLSIGVIPPKKAVVVKTVETIASSTEGQRVETTKVETQETKETIQQEEQVTIGFEPWGPSEVVPDSDETVIKRSVAPEHMLAITGGPMKVAGRSFPGMSQGQSRGTVLIIKGGDVTYSIEITSVVGGANWAQDYIGEDYEGLASDRIAAMFDPQQGNCEGKGCKYGVDVLILQLSEDGPIVIDEYLTKK